MRHPTKFRGDRLNRCQDSNFPVFKMAAVRRLGLLKNSILTTDRVRGQVCVIMPHFVVIGQTFAGLLRSNGFKYDSL